MESVTGSFSESKANVTERRVRSTSRLQYEAQVNSFIRQHGQIEEIRQKLGLSRRKICQLLMVDPSAWTRWTRQKDRIPPHIYRSLQWYLALEHKMLTQPDLAQWFLREQRVQESAPIAEFAQMRAQIAELETRSKTMRNYFAGLCLLLAATSLLLAIYGRWQ